jgi:hypothetical protein
MPLLRPFEICSTHDKGAARYGNLSLEAGGYHLEPTLSWRRTEEIAIILSFILEAFSTVSISLCNERKTLIYVRNMLELFYGGKDGRQFKLGFQYLKPRPWFRSIVSCV